MPGLHRAAHRVGLQGKLAQAHGAARNADDRHLALADDEVLLGAFEMLGRDAQDLLAHDALAAALMALPATTAPRLAKVPAPQ